MVETIATLAAANAEYAEAETALERIASSLIATTSAPSKQKGRGPNDKLAAAQVAAPDWWLAAIDMLLVHTRDGGAEAARHIKDQLGQKDTCALRSAAEPSHTYSTSNMTCCIHVSSFGVNVV